MNELTWFALANDVEFGKAPGRGIVACTGPDVAIEGQVAQELF